MIFTSASIPEAKLRVEETFIFLGNSFTASDAFPSNIICSSSPSISWPNDNGGFLVTNDTDSISPRRAAFTVSIPEIAPVGKYIFAPFSLAVDSRDSLKSLSNNAPTLIIITSVPLSSIWGTELCTAACDADSNIKSEFSINSSNVL